MLLLSKPACFRNKSIGCHSFITTKLEQEGEKRKKEVARQGNTDAKPKVLKIKKISQKLNYIHWHRNVQSSSPVLTKSIAITSNLVLLLTRDFVGEQIPIYLCHRIPLQSIISMINSIRIQ